jgi:integrase
MTETMTRSAASAVICLPVSEWPAIDRELWVRARQKVGLLDEPRPAAGWAPITQESVAKAYGRWLHWLTVSSWLDPLLPPAQRVTFERIQAYVAELQACNAPNTVHMRILHLGRMLDVMEPGSKPEWFGRVLRKLYAARRPVRDDRARLVPALDLQALGWALLKRAEQQTQRAPHRWSPRWRALHYRDGLLILLLGACSLRARSLAALRIGRHLERRGDCWWVVLGHTDTKTRRSAMVLPLPAAFTGAIERYLAQWRPVLLSRQTAYGAVQPVDSGSLWLSKSGKPVTPKGFNELINRVTRRENELINRVTRRELGRPVNPHLFRKIVPTELAIRDPGHVGIAQVLLGHASYETTDRAYNLARALDAARQVQDTMGALRREATGAREPRRRRAAISRMRRSS